MVLDILNTANKEHREGFQSVFDKIEEKLKENSVSTSALFREFTIRAVNDSSIVIVHPEKIKVTLIQKVKNTSMIESVIEEVYKPLKIVAININEWKTCKAVYSERNN